MADSFHGVIAFALIVFMLVVGAALRRRIGWLRKGLVPASIIGGVIGLVLVTVGAFPGYAPKDFVAITFHFFTLSFMALPVIPELKLTDKGLFDVASFGFVSLFV